MIQVCLIFNSIHRLPLPWHTSIADVSSWTKAETIASCAVAFLTLLAIVFAALAWWLSRRNQKTDLISSYFKEYRSTEIGKAVAKLYEFKKSSGSTESMIFKYIKEYKQLSDFHLITRRSVSAFYQEMAVLAARSRFFRKIVYSGWGKSDLKIIPEIILPIECIAMPLANLPNRLALKQKRTWIRARLVDGKIRYSPKWPPPKRALYQLWKKAPDDKYEY